VEEGPVDAGGAGDGGHADLLAVGGQLVQGAEHALAPAGAVAAAGRGEGLCRASGHAKPSSGRPGAGVRMLGMPRWTARRVARTTSMAWVIWCRSASSSWSRSAS